MNSCVRKSFWGLLFVFLTLHATAATRIALMDFSTDDNSFRSGQRAADFASLLQNRLAGEAGVEWVERAQLDKARVELELSAQESMNGAQAVSRGKWAQADWMITGQFSLDDQNRRILGLEITELRHADVLASRTVAFPGNTTNSFEIVTNQLEVAAETLHQLLSEAKARQRQMTGKILVAPLFFAELSGIGAPQTGAILRRGFDEALERAAATNSRIQLIHFPKAYRSMDESELVLDGLVEADQNAWQQTADLYVWGTYLAEQLPGRPRGLPSANIRIQLHLWDGGGQPVVVTNDISYDFWSKNIPAAQAQAVLDRLVNQVMSKANRRTGPAGSTAVHQEISRSLIRTYNEMTGQFYGRENLGLNDPDKFLQAVHMLETACFFDPDNADARALYLTCRWGWWMDFGFNVKNEFRSKWRRSEVWAKYVNRFGLGSVQEELPFPYNRNGGIPAVYVSSLSDVLEMFPQWHSADEAALEDEWQRQGVHTSLMEAEFYGFPRQMPHDLALKWKADVEAELARRKQKVAEFSQTVAATATTVSNRPSANRPKPPVIRHIRSPAASPKVPIPEWVRDISQKPCRFSLPVPNVLQGVPEVRPVVRAIHFPAQFEVQLVKQMDFLGGKLLILAMDQRSNPSSDANPDVSAELLKRQERLWTLAPEATGPTLYEPELFPGSVHAFLLQSNRLWTAGQDIGYLDLAARTFHRYGLSDGISLTEPSAIGLAAGHFFAAGDFSRVLQLDAATGHWSELPGPREGGAYSSSYISCFAAWHQWLWYSAGSARLYDVSANTVTGLPGLYGANDVVTDDRGFWIGNTAGLHFYEPEGKHCEHRPAPIAIPGLFDSFVGYAPFNLMTGDTVSQDNLDSLSQLIQGRLKQFQGKFGSSAASRTDGEEDSGPLHIVSRIPGEVTALANDGDFLWVGAGNSLLLVNKPTRTCLAFYQAGIRGHISSLAVSDKSVYIGLAYGDQLLLEIPRAAFLSAPRSQWVNLTVSPADRAAFISAMTPPEQALYAYYAGDAAGVAKVLGTIAPDIATLPEMFLLAFCHDVRGLNQPVVARAWFDRIIQRYPDSPWAVFATRMEAENDLNEQKLKVQALGTADDPTAAAAREQLLEMQMAAVIKRYDQDGDGQLNLAELKTLAQKIALFTEAKANYPQLKQTKSLADLEPLLSKNFPAAETILERYDLNRDRKIDAAELAALARQTAKDK